MGQLYASIAIGTAVTLSATVLFLLRIQVQGHRPILALTRRWVATTPRTSGLVLALLSAIAVFCFARIADEVWSNSGTSTVSSNFNSQTDASGVDDSSDVASAWAALHAYVDQIESNSKSIAAAPSEANSVALPDVDTMIAKLIARLEKQPNDVNGWKMLGWSYLNTGRPNDATKAYETALKLEPGDVEIRKGLEAAKSAETAAARPSPSNSTPQPTDDDIKSAENLSETERNGMIHSMVDRLAARLETSPNDENGWLRLMSSRMTLGEKDEAKAALMKALAAFAGDAAATTRITAAARELGIEPN
jgi:cytochrome c-type biogenesis protein CcmH